MLLAVEGGGLFSASASGYTKGLTLLFSAHKDGDRPMRVVPWTLHQQEVTLDSFKTRVSRGCACFRARAEPAQHRDIVPESVSQKADECVSESDDSTKQGEVCASEGDDRSKLGFKLSLRSSLKRPSSVVESRSLEDIKEHETLSVDGSDVGGDVERRKVQWPDACGSELTQVREFEPSEMGLSDDEWETGREKTCSCVIM